MRTPTLQVTVHRYENVPVYRTVLRCATAVETVRRHQYNTTSRQVRKCTCVLLARKGLNYQYDSTHRHNVRLANIFEDAKHGLAGRYRYRNNQKLRLIDTMTYLLRTNAKHACLIIENYDSPTERTFCKHFTRREIRHAQYRYRIDRGPLADKLHNYCTATYSHFLLDFRFLESP